MTTTYGFRMTFTVRGESNVGLDEACDQVMRELLGLESAGCGIHSAAVSVDLRTHAVEIEVAADADSEDVAEAAARSCIRSAIHSTGGFTAGWDAARTTSLASIA